MQMHSLSIISALTSFIVSIDESTSTAHSDTHPFTCGSWQARRLPVIVSDKQMTSACPRAAQGMRHCFFIRQNKAELWWYHLKVTTPLPTPTTLSQSDNSKLPCPIMVFLSRLFVFSEALMKNTPLSPFFCFEYHILKCVCLNISLIDAHNQSLLQTYDWCPCKGKIFCTTN